MMYYTVVPIENDGKVRRKCQEIQEEDETFRFKIDKKGYGSYLKVESKTYDQAQQRGQWLLNKCDYIKEQDTYYWVEDEDGNTIKPGDRDGC